MSSPPSTVASAWAMVACGDAQARRLGAVHLDHDACGHGCSTESSTSTMSGGGLEDLAHLRAPARSGPRSPGRRPPPPGARAPAVRAGSRRSWRCRRGAGRSPARGARRPSGDGVALAVAVVLVDQVDLDVAQVGARAQVVLAHQTVEVDGRGGAGIDLVVGDLRDRRPDSRPSRPAPGRSAPGWSPRACRAPPGTRSCCRRAAS